MVDTTDNSISCLDDESTAKMIARNMETGWVDLTEQKKAFAYEYIANGFKHREAAAKIGFNPNSAMSVLRDPMVSAFISHLQEKHFTSTIITKQFVESYYLELLPRLAGEEEIDVVNASGECFRAKKFHGSEIVSVLRDLSKATGYAKEEDKSNIVNIQMNFAAVMSKPEVIIDGNSDG